MLTDQIKRGLMLKEANGFSDQDCHEEKLHVSLHDGPYWTEGIRNPGWLTVLGTWVTYFACAGAINSWGVFQAE